MVDREWRVEDALVGSDGGKIQGSPSGCDKVDNGVGGGCGGASQTCRHGVSLQVRVHTWSQERVPDAMGSAGPGDIPKRQ